MGDQFLGEIRMFAIRFAPKGWAMCDGQSLPVQQNEALFAILGNLYGGDGKVTFNLPDLRGRTPIGEGRSPTSKTLYARGQKGGDTVASLPAAPMHGHRVRGNEAIANQNLPAGYFLANAREPANQTSIKTFGAATANTLTALHPDSVSETGANAPFSIRQPFLGLNFCIALVGLYPPKGD